MDLARAKHPKTTRNERHDATWRRLWVRQHSRPSRDWSTSIVSWFVSASLSLSLFGQISSNVYRLPTELRCIYHTARDYVSVVGCVALAYQLTLASIVYFLTSICGPIFYRATRVSSLSELQIFNFIPLRGPLSFLFFFYSLESREYIDLVIGSTSFVETRVVSIPRDFEEIASRLLVLFPNVASIIRARPLIESDYETIRGYLLSRSNVYRWSETRIYGTRSNGNVLNVLSNIPWPATFSLRLGMEIFRWFIPSSWFEQLFTASSPSVEPAMTTKESIVYDKPRNRV